MPKTLELVAEWQSERGVLYLHHPTKGYTILRICNLPHIPVKDQASGTFDIHISECEMMECRAVGRQRLPPELHKLMMSIPEGEG